MIQATTATAKKTFEYILPPLTVAIVAIALYQISQQSRPQEEKAIQAAGVSFLGTMILCSTNRKIQKIFAKEFWEKVSSTLFSPTDFQPVEVIANKLTLSSSPRDPSLQVVYETLDLLLATNNQLAVIRDSYLDELQIDLEEAAYEMRQAHQNIFDIESSLFMQLQDLEQKKILNKEELHLLDRLSAKRQNSERNRKIFTPQEVQIALREQQQRCIQQAKNEPHKTFRYAYNFLPALETDSPWEQNSENSFAYKCYAKGENLGICEAIGRREEMEDAVLATEVTINVSGKIHNLPLFGVFDGHLGSLKGKNALKASDYVKARLPSKIEKKIEYFLNNSSTDDLSDDVLYNALHHSLVELHEEYPGLNGTTVNIGLIANHAIYAANIGDSRSIFVDEEGYGIQLTEDSKADNPRHKKIINNLGGQVSFLANSWRVSQVIGMGSALGDPNIVGINPTVDITKTMIPSAGGVYVLACDGLWDTISSQNIYEIIFNNRHESAASLAQNILYSAWLADAGDNLSAIVVKFT